MVGTRPKTSATPSRRRCLAGPTGFARGQVQWAINQRPSAGRLRSLELWLSIGSQTRPAAPVIRACCRVGRGDPNRYGRPEFTQRFVKVTGEDAMDENRAEGTVRKVAGKVQEGVGWATGDAKMQAEGMANEISGSAQDLYGQVQDSASELVRSASDAVGKFIKEQPYTATLIALGIGWLLGR